MKKLFLTLGLLVFLSAAAFAFEPFGFIYQDTEQPLMGAGGASASKIGTATCSNFFGLVAVGNCSVKKAMQKGGIKSLSFADQSVMTILGFSHIETRAYGN